MSPISKTALLYANELTPLVRLAACEVVEQFAKNDNVKRLLSNADWALAESAAVRRYNEEVERERTNQNP